MKKYLLISILFFMNLMLSTQTQAEFSIVTDQIIVAQEGNTQKILFNLSKNLKELANQKDGDKEKLILEGIQKYIEKNLFGDKNIKTSEVKIVIINNLDEYARPDFSNMTKIGTFDLDHENLSIKNNTFDAGALNTALEKVK